MKRCSWTGPMRPQLAWRPSYLFVPLLLLAASALVALPVFSQAQLAHAVPPEGLMGRSQGLVALDADPLERFGWSVDIDGDTAVVGSPWGDATGFVCVYVRSGGAWVWQQTLHAEDDIADQRFGCSVAISGDTVVVGAFADDHGGGTDAGAAYVFTRTDSVWLQQEKLVAMDREAGDVFGSSVAVNGDTAVVGAPFDDNAHGSDAGAAYVFVREAGGWSQQDKLLATDGAAGDHFGSSVAVSSDTAAAGAPEHLYGAGSAYVFVRSITTWTFQRKTVASDGETGAHFGNSLDLDGNTLVAGAFADDNAGGTDAGAAYVFIRAGATWYAQQQLLATPARPAAYFGRSVAIDGDIAVAGADGDGGDFANSGVGYAFVRSGATWTQAARAVAPSAALQDSFGMSAGISGTTAIFGAPGDDTGDGADAGSAYVFSSWLPVYRFYRPSSGTHFYTPNEAEKAYVTSNLSKVYTYEGVAYGVNPENNNQALYRFYNKRNGSHFYTASTAERDSVIANLSAIYSYDGPTYKVSTAAAPDKPPVWRFYNKRNGSHFYTASEAEKASVIANLAGIYTYEGIAFWLGQ